MKKKYEIMFILNIRLDEETKKGTIEKVTQAIVKANGEVEKVDDLGRKRLAYSIQKQNDGNYILINFEAETRKIGEITRACQLNENILRSMVVLREEAPAAVA